MGVFRRNIMNFFKFLHFRQQIRHQPCVTRDKRDISSVWESCVTRDWRIDRNCTVAVLFPSQVVQRTYPCNLNAGQPALRVHGCISYRWSILLDTYPCEPKIPVACLNSPIPADRTTDFNCLGNLPPCELIASEMSVKMSGEKAKRWHRMTQVNPYVCTAHNGRPKECTTWLFFSEDGNIRTPKSSLLGTNGNCRICPNLYCTSRGLSANNFSPTIMRARDGGKKYGLLLAAESRCVFISNKSMRIPMWYKLQSRDDLRYIFNLSAIALILE